MKLNTSFSLRPDFRSGLGLRTLLLGGLGLFALLPCSNAQRMTVSESDAAPVTVETAAVSTEVTGRIAVTTFDLVFRNPNNRQLEGTFEFPLLEGQSVIRFALDIGGSLREAVPVEKERGRVVFEEIERRRVDPGLLEQTAGNNYRARIFPLPAKGTRRIVIAYQEDIKQDAAGESTYRLALDFPQRLRRFGLAVSVHSSASTPAQVRTTLPLELPAWNKAMALELKRSDFDARGLLELSLPPVQTPTLLTQRIGAREYFCVEAPIGDIAPVRRAAPAVVGLLWDASGSGRDRDHAKEFAFLDEWFRVVPDVEVRLVCLRDVAAPTEIFRVRSGNWAELRHVLEKVVYDGATSFDGLKDDAAVQEWMLFSDGLVNYGATGGATRLACVAPVHAVLASTAADPTWLRGLATRHGGEFANLLAQDAVAAVARVRTSALRVLGIERDPEAVAQVFPEVGSVVRQSNFVVAGLLRRSEATIRLRIGHSEADAREIVAAVKSGVGPSQLAARAWATAKIAALSLDADGNREDIRRTSQEFGIVTADTSLIVLETIEDYLRYDIAPPEELRSQWEALRRRGSGGGAKDRDRHLDAVARVFAQREARWNTHFPKDEPMAADRSMVDRARREPASIESVPASTADAGFASDGGPVGTDEEVVVLSPFVVTASEDRGYRASDTLAGTRVRTELRDIGSSISVVNEQFMQDTGSTSNADLLRYTPNTEVGGGAPGSTRVQPATTIALQPWSPQAGYLDRLRRAPVGDWYATYLEERADHLRDPGFYLDVAEFFFEGNNPAVALCILSNLAELQLEDAALLRVLGQRLLQASRPELALPLFERVLKIRGEDPQSRRDLALACAATRQFQRAVDLLWEMVERPWSNRFPDIQMVVLGELNALAATCGEKLDLSKIDRRLRRNLPVGLRAVVTWDADNCDMDLWVDDPNGERAKYSHNLTYQGGWMSRDFTGGYGPEEFLLKEPKPGTYTVRINYYGDQRNTALGPVTAQVRLITGFGTPEQNERLLTVRFTTRSETQVIGSIEIAK